MSEVGCSAEGGSGPSSPPGGVQVLGQLDRGHAASAEFVLDPVAVGEGGAQTHEGVGHVALRDVPRVNSRLGSLSVN